MLRPAAFGFNTETAASNAFQQQTQATDAAVKAAQVEPIKALLAAEHPYDTPACLVLAVTDGLPDYLQWIARETL